MKTNFYKEVHDECLFFAEKFLSIGWKQEDEFYFTKSVGFVTNPDSRNEEWKNKLTFVMYPELLTYIGSRKGQRGVDEIWICCRTEMSLDDEIKRDFWKSVKLKNTTQYFKNELEKIGWKPFYDEDAFRGIFTRPKIIDNLDSVRMAFYLNKDYPEGMWENHTLD